MKKTFTKFLLILAVLSIYIYCFTLGQPAFFFDSLGWAKDTHFNNISSIDWLRYEDLPALRKIFPQMGSPVDNQGYILIVNGDYESSGHYAKDNNPIPVNHYSGAKYVMRNRTNIQTFTEPKKPDYAALDKVGSLRRSGIISFVLSIAYKILFFFVS